MAHERFELRDKVEFRKKQLNDALDKAESSKLPDERIVGLRNELMLVDDALSGGWNNVSEVTAAQLSGWLESTKYLVDTQAGPVPETERATRPMAALPEKKSSDKSGKSAAPSKSEQSDDKVGKPMVPQGTRPEDHDPQREAVNVRPDPKSPDLSNASRSQADFDNPAGIASNGTRR